MSTKFRPDIEGLRGVAVLDVVAYHVGLAGFATGLIGVDIFFVLSGYLITGLLVAEIGRAGRLDLLAFYARRIRRLLPAAALVIVAILIAAVLLAGPQDLINIGRAARATAVYLGNVFFAATEANYFAANVKTNPLLHMWSLAVEEQFYLFWPLLILLGLVVRRSRRTLLALLATVSAISLVICVRTTATQPVFAFYQLPARAWEFGAGALAVLLPLSPRTRPSIRLAWGWIGLAGVVASAMALPSSGGFPGWAVAIPVLATVLALMAGEQPVRFGPSLVLNTRVLQVLGRLSYSWYLWHWPFLVFAAMVIPDPGVGVRILAALAGLGAAALTHFLVENPVRFQPRLVSSWRLTVSLAVVLMVVSVGLGFGVKKLGERRAEDPAMARITAATQDYGRLPNDRCHVYRTSTLARVCNFGDTTSATTILLFGDSHAMHWFNPLERIAEGHRWKLTVLVRAGCDAVDVPMSETDPFRVGCEGWRAASMAFIDTLRPALVFLANATNKPQPVSPAELREAMARTLRTLTARGTPVVLMRDNPFLPFNGPSCLARPLSLKDPGACAALKEHVLNPAIFAAETAAARGVPGTYVLDLTGVMCPGDRCPVMVDGVIVYRDSNHLTGAFADYLTPSIEARLVPLVAAGADRGSDDR